MIGAANRAGVATQNAGKVINAVTAKA